MMRKIKNMNMETTDSTEEKLEKVKFLIINHPIRAYFLMKYFKDYITEDAPNYFDNLLIDITDFSPNWIGVWSLSVIAFLFFPLAVIPCYPIHKARKLYQIRKTLKKFLYNKNFT